MKVSSSQSWRSIEAWWWRGPQESSQKHKPLHQPCGRQRTPGVSGEALSVAHRLVMLHKTCGMFRGPKSGKQGWFEEGQVQKNKREGYAKRQLHINRWRSVNAWVWLVHSISSDFPGCKVPWALCVCVVRVWVPVVERPMYLWCQYGEQWRCTVSEQQTSQWSGE